MNQVERPSTAESGRDRQRRFREALENWFPRLRADPKTKLDREYVPTDLQLTRWRELRDQRRQHTAWCSLGNGALEPLRQAIDQVETTRHKLQEAAAELAKVWQSPGDPFGLEALPAQPAPQPERDAIFNDGATVRWRPLSFAPDFALVAVQTPTDSAIPPVRWISRRPENGASVSVVALLRGESPTIHQWNDQRATASEAAVHLTDPDMLAHYVRFFCHHIAGDEDYFHVIEDLEDIQFEQQGDGEPHVHTLWFTSSREGEREQFEDDLRQRLWPLTQIDSPDPERPRVAGTVFYQGNLFHSVFEVREDGTMEMIADAPVPFGNRDASSLPLKALRSPRAVRTYGSSEKST